MGYLQIYKNWLSDKRLNSEAKKELESVKDNKEEIEYRFGAELEFGYARAYRLRHQYDERVHG